MPKNVIHFLQVQLHLHKTGILYGLRCIFDDDLRWRDRGTVLQGYIKVNKTDNNEFIISYLIEKH